MRAQAPNTRDGMTIEYSSEAPGAMATPGRPRSDRQGGWGRGHAGCETKTWPRWTAAFNPVVYLSVAMAPGLNVRATRGYCSDVPFSASVLATPRQRAIIRKEPNIMHWPVRLLDRKATSTMRHSLVSTVLLGITAVLLSGCLNRSTPSSRITGTLVSSTKYESYSCAQLTAELDSFSRRETQLVAAQDQRKKSSDAQAFWWGHGQGDGIEASELANVRGEIGAIRKAMDLKGCK